MTTTWLLYALLLGAIATAAAVALMRERRPAPPELSVWLGVDTSAFVRALEDLGRSFDRLGLAALRAASHATWEPVLRAASSPDTLWTSPPWTTFSVTRPRSLPVLAFEVAAAKADARTIVREGLRLVAPAAVHAVEMEDWHRAARQRLQDRLDRLMLEAGLRVIDPASMVRGSFPA